MLGYGIVGGSLLNLDELSRKIVDASIRILNGEPPNRIKVPPQTPGQPVFDWRELRRWGIPESRLPANSVVLFRAPSLWQEYRVTVLTALGVMAIQFFLISGLLVRTARTTPRRVREPEEPGARRRREPARNDVGAHQLDRP